VLEGDTLAVPDETDWRDLPEGTERIIATGRVGKFVVWKRGGRVELWDMRKEACLVCLARYRDIHKISVQDRSLYLLRRRVITILENCL
jgi:hypothetical protein